jgi:DNA repair exonuclease SbcCD ATPase subunit
MYLKRSITSNFGVIGYCDLSFEENEKYLIVGENLDGANSTNSNGTGKSTWIKARKWCLDGDSGTWKADEVIGYNSDEAFTEDTYDHNGELFIIRRTRLKGGGGDVKYTYYDVNGEGKSISDIPAKLKPVIFGILFPERELSSSNEMSELLEKIVFINGDKLDSFSSMTPAQRMEFISTLMDNKSVKEIENISEIFKNKKMEINGKLEMLKDNILDVVMLETYQRSLLSYGSDVIEKKEFEKIAIKDISDTNRKKDLLLSQLQEHQKQIKTVNDEIIQLNVSKNKIENEYNNYLSIVKNIEKLENDCKTFNNDIDKNNELLSKYQYTEGELTQFEPYKVELSQIKSQISNLSTQKQLVINCPQCETALIYSNKQLILTTNTDKIQEEVDTLNKRKTYLEEEISKFNIIIDLLNKIKDLSSRKQLLINQIDTEKDKIKDKTANFYHTESEKLANKIDSLSYSIDTKISDDLLSQIKTITTELETKNKELLNLTSDISQLNSKIKEYEQKIDTHSKNIEKYKTGEDVKSCCEDWMKLIKTYSYNRISQLLNNFEIEADNMFEILTNGGHIQFDFTNLDTNNPKFNISAKLAENNDFRSINTFSSGEIRRCGLALTLAARNSILINNKLNFIFLDESLDRLDAAGRTLVSIYLLESNQQAFIVSHTDDVSNMFAKQIHITKINGSSTVELR